MARVVDAIVSHRLKRLSCVAAAEALGMSERHFRRLRDVYEEEGADGLIDARRGRANGRRAPVDEIEWVLDAFATRYFDFRTKHFHECVLGAPMRDGTPFQRSYSWTKSVLQSRGLVGKAKKRGKHLRKRERKPLAGMMLMQDGSTHDWFGDGRHLDLIVTLDDATSNILSMFFVGEEGTASTFRGLAETIARHGLFSSFYTDRGSHYFYTPQAGGKVDPNRLTQVGRALKQLNIQHIASYTPQGRGRMERVWDTLQKRLAPLLRLNGLTGMEAANIWLKDVYMAQHNATFGGKQSEEGTAFIPFIGDLINILCIEEERVVSGDNCVSYRNLKLQIPPGPHRHHFVKTTVRVLEYWDGAMAIFHGPRQIASFHLDGSALTEQETPRKSAA